MPKQFRERLPTLFLPADLPQSVAVPCDKKDSDPPAHPSKARRGQERGSASDEKREFSTAWEDGVDPEEEADPTLLPNGRLPSYIKDHRKRLRSRFLEAGPIALPDYEMLELVLFNALPRQDVKPLARRLFDVFSDLNTIITASPARLRQVEGVGDSVIFQLRLHERTAASMMRAKVLNRHALSGWQAVLDYCHASMAHRAVEQFRVLFLDRKNMLIADEEQARGTVDHVPVYPREVIKRALELDASALILVHNHPSGDPTPSGADISMTLQIRDIAELLGLVLHDHIIIGRSRETSFRSEGYL